MITIGGADPTAPGLTKQFSLPHETKNLFVIDPDSFPMELGGDPTIPITVELFDQLLDPFDQGGFIWLFLLALIVVTTAGEAHELAPPLDTLEKLPVLGKELPFF